MRWLLAHPWHAILRSSQAKCNERDGRSRTMCTSQYICAVLSLGGATCNMLNSMFGTSASACRACAIVACGGMEWWSSLHIISTWLAFEYCEFPTNNATNVQTFPPWVAYWLNNKAFQSKFYHWTINAWSVCTITQLISQHFCACMCAALLANFAKTKINVKSAPAWSW